MYAFLYGCGAGLLAEPFKEEESLYQYIKPGRTKLYGEHTAYVAGLTGFYFESKVEAIKKITEAMKPWDTPGNCRFLFGVITTAQIHAIEAVRELGWVCVMDAQNYANGISLWVYRTDNYREYKGIAFGKIKKIVIPKKKRSKK